MEKFQIDYENKLKKLCANNSNIHLFYIFFSKIKICAQFKCSYMFLLFACLQQKIKNK